MNIEEFREYCLSLKGVREKMPFLNVPDKYSRDVLCFYVADKWHMNKKYWISVYFNQDVPDEKIKELVSKSYDIVVKNLTKKEREMLLSSGE